MLTDRAVLATAGNGSFHITDHAVESFRIRIANLSPIKVRAIIRQQVADTVSRDGLAGMEPATNGGGWVVRVTAPRYKYKFWAVLSEAREEPGVLLAVTVYFPRRLGGSISQVAHNTIVDEMRRELLRAEDKYNETFERLMRRESKQDAPIGTSVTHCECCVHRLFTDEEADTEDAGSEAPGEPGSGTDSDGEV